MLSFNACYFLCSSSQAVYYIIPDSTFLRSVVLSILTFGLGQVCLSKDLTATQLIALMIVQPAILLFLIWIMHMLAKNSTCAKHLYRVQRRHSVLHMLWLVIIYSYSAMAFTALHLIICVRLSNRYVLHFDGSVECFGKKHLPYGVFSIVLLACIVVPFPFLLAWQSYRPWHRLIGLIDEATHIYEHKRRWWVGVNFIRRLLLPAVAIGASESNTRQVLLAVVILLMFAIHYAFR